jgi:hypothetical protein
MSGRSAADLPEIALILGMQVRGHNVVRQGWTVVAARDAVMVHADAPTGACTSSGSRRQAGHRWLEEGATRPDAAHHGGSIRERATPTSTLGSTPLRKIDGFLRVAVAPTTPTSTLPRGRALLSGSIGAYSRPRACLDSCLLAAL